MSVSADDVRRAIRAAGEAGFEGISLWTLHHLLAAGDGMDDAELTDLLAVQSLRVPIVEAMPGWANAADEAAVRADAAFAMSVAEAVCAEVVVAVCMEPALADRDRAVANLALVGDITADAGLSVAVEFLPWTAIDSFATVNRLVDDADRDNVGILVDTWHWQRQAGGPDFAGLAATPGSRIKLVQLADTIDPPRPDGDLFTEAMSARAAPGAGVVDFAALLDGLGAIGANPLFSPEVFNAKQLRHGQTAWATTVRGSCNSVLR